MGPNSPRERVDRHVATEIGHNVSLNNVPQREAKFVRCCWTTLFWFSVLYELRNFPLQDLKTAAIEALGNRIGRIDVEELHDIAQLEAMNITDLLYARIKEIVAYELQADKGTLPRSNFATSTGAFRSTQSMISPSGATHLVQRSRQAAIDEKCQAYDSCDLKRVLVSHCSRKSFFFGGQECQGNCHDPSEPAPP